MLRLVFASSALLLIVCGINAEEKKAGSVLIEVTPDKMAAEFEADAEAAKKKYSPNPPPGAKAGGAIIDTDGPIEVKGGKVYLKNKTGVKIVLDGAELPEKEGRWAAVLKGTTFKRYQGKTIHLDGSKVKYQRIIGEKK